MSQNFSSYIRFLVRLNILFCYINIIIRWCLRVFKNIGSWSKIVDLYLVEETSQNDQTVSEPNQNEKTYLSEEQNAQECLPLHLHPIRSTGTVLESLEVVLDLIKQKMRMVMGITCLAIICKVK